jgi:hypothetical protein
MFLKWMIICCCIGATWLRTPALAAEGKANAKDQKSEFEQRFAPLQAKKPGSAKSLHELADFCRLNLLFDERIRTLRQLVVYFPDDHRARHLLGEMKHGAEWMTYEQAFKSEAQVYEAKGMMYYGERWMPRLQAERTREADRKAIQWSFNSRCDTKHMQVYSALDGTTTRCMALLAENTGYAYQQIYGQIYSMKGNVPLKVYLFANSDEMGAFCQRVGNPMRSPYGFYDSGLQAFLAPAHVEGFPADYQDYIVKHTVVHEMTHALDRQWSSLPKAKYGWMNEGPAEYMGMSRDGLQVVPGYPGAASRANCSAITSTSLEVFVPKALQTDLRQLLSTASLDEWSYPVAGTFIHFLWHGDGGKYRTGYTRFLQMASSKQEPEDLEKALGASLAVLQPRFHEHVARVFVRK